MSTIAENSIAGNDTTDSVEVAPLWIGNLRIDPPIFQAPMAGYTNFAFRQIVREYGGAGLQATEMVNARGFVWLDEHDCEHPDRLWGVKEEARPLAVQIWDNDPEIMAKVGIRLAQEYGVSVVDINFGCPVKQVTEKAHSGSYLLRDPERMYAIISRLVEVCYPTPVTAKIRLGCTRKTMNHIQIAQMVERAGASALTVHGRTAEDFFKGSADWNRISEIKAHLGKMPLIGNGDLQTPEQVVYAFKHYQVDGVMIARAALGRPWLFAQAAAAGILQPFERAAMSKAIVGAIIPASVFLSVNLSPETVLAFDPGAMVPDRPPLVIEITEHAPVEDYDALVPVIERLKQRGVRLAIDDAGAGFASMRHILRLEPDLIKLDISITRGVDTDKKRRSLAAALISFAGESGIGVIAEGIETADELATLSHLGATYGQGFLLGRPGPLPVHARRAA